MPFVCWLSSAIHCDNLPCAFVARICLTDNLFTYYNWLCGVKHFDSLLKYSPLLLLYSPRIHILAHLLESFHSLGVSPWLSEPQSLTLTHPPKCQWISYFDLGNVKQERTAPIKVYNPLYHFNWSSLTTRTNLNFVSFTSFWSRWNYQSFT